MKHLMRYEGYTSKERADDILDKISKYGIKSITPLEREFLDSHSQGKEEEVHNRISKEETDSVFEDDWGYFKFEHKETEDYGDEVHFIGTIYVPDLELLNGKKIEGVLEGRIIVFENGDTSLDFYSTYGKRNEDKYDIFEFCNGLEYELDTFIDYVIKELSGEKN